MLFMTIQKGADMAGQHSRGMERRAGVFVVAVWLAGIATAQDKAAVPRESIGQVYGRTVYRDEVVTSNGAFRKDVLVGKFAGPVSQAYRKTHRDRLAPTDAELDAVTAYFDQQHEEKLKETGAALRDELDAIEKQLAATDLKDEERRSLKNRKLGLQFQLRPPGRQFSRFLLENWKFQRHLYDEFGGGRVLWQQAGVEAFDATRKWLEFHEQKGDFTITDPEARAAFYDYWTRSHGPFLITDEARIRSEFLEPAWMQKAATKPGTE